MTRSLEGKAAIITGASKGIGRATALRLAAEGARLTLGSTGLPLLEEVAETAAKTGVPVLTARCDVSRMDDCLALTERALAAFDGVDILVSNAGVGFASCVAESDPRDIERMVRVNLLGVYNMARAVLPSMRARSAGDIVNVGSVAATRPSPGFAMYAATKAAVRAFSESLRMEVRGHNIRVTVIHPGMTNTAFFDAFSKEGEGPLPLHEGELLSPEHVADAIVFALKQPEGSALNELVIRPTWQER